MLRNPLFYRVICLFLVVYQKKYHFCLHVFQNISIFERYSAPLPTK